jgi:hypothetical protein
MSATVQPYRVFYEDGREVDVTADQRDIVVFERANGVGFAAAMDRMMITAIREIAFYALRRKGLVEQGLSVRAWSDTVIEVEPDPDAETVADPGQPEAREDGSSD